MGHALIVEDNIDSARMMAALVAIEGYSASTAHSLRDARRMLALQQPDVIFLDLNLPDGSGLALLHENSAVGNCDVVLMTGNASIESSIEALRMGATDYLVKPIDPQRLQYVLSKARRPPLLKKDIQELRSEWQRTGSFGHLVGRSAPMESIYEQIARVAPTSVSVFVTGESGTGKELVARTVHDLSQRNKKQFLAVNCGAISPNLMESEIFGHEKGSFTGADRQHQGLFERAHMGTLFLDEITEMPPALQVKLLRVLETGTFSRVGSTDLIQTDVRVIAATNRDLRDAVSAGALREDLMFRLNVFPIEMPPLRSRKDDIPTLARHFLRTISEREGSLKQLTPSALGHMQQYDWPGNVRELRNAMQRSYVMSDGDVTDEWLPRSAAASSRAENTTPISGTLDVARTELATFGRVPLGSPLADVEREYILAIWRHCDQHKERTAAMLGVSIKTLYNRLKEYGVGDR